MKKVKRILALSGAVLLFGMYGSTLVFALMDSPVSFDLLRASVVATVLIPVLLYGFLLIARLTGGSGNDSSDPSETGDTTDADRSRGRTED